MIHIEPFSYKPTLSYIEQILTLFLVKLAIKSKQINFSFDAGVDEKEEFVIRLPRLFNFLWMLVLPDLFVGTYYCKGLWYLKKGDISELIRHLDSHGFSSWYKKYYMLMSKKRGPLFYIKRVLFNLNYRSRIADHYDIDSDLYELFLDQEMLYTCAFFENNKETLEVAQKRKLDIIVKRLNLSNPISNILDIGSGWGGLSRFITDKYKNAHVTGLSLSKGQITWAEKRNLKILPKKQQSRIKYVQQSIYDHQSMLYDGIVAVGMIEHVGKKSYLKFFKKIKSLLKKDGRIVIHTIVCPYNNFPSSRWIDENIFPGGYAPSISEIASAIEDSGLLMDGIHLYEGKHYVKTIELWREKFINNWASGYEHIRNKFSSKEQEDIFFRTWYFYLSSVRNMFFEDVWKYKVAHFVIKKHPQ